MFVGYAFWRLDTPSSCRVWHLLMREELFSKMSQTSQPKAVSKVVAGRFLGLVCSLDVFWRLETQCSCRVWLLLMREELFCQISETSQPKAVSKVVAGRFYDLYVRSIYFGAWTHPPRAVYGIC